MGTKISASALFASILFVSACAQQEETIIRPQPVFDKYGNGGCEADNGQIVHVPGANYETLPPCEDVCTDGGYTDAAGNSVEPCLPPPGRQDDNDDDTPSGGVNAAGAPIN